MTLQFVDDTSEATWLLPDASDRAAAEAVLGFGPPMFEAYARVLHLPDPQFDRQPEADLPDEVFDHAPSEVEVVGRTLEALHAGSSPREIVSFLLWVGYPYRPALPDRARFDFSGLRSYALARGSVNDWRDWAGDHGDHGRAFPAAFVWPASREWCLAFDVDSHFAGVGASDEAIARLLLTDGLTAERAVYGAPTKSYG